MARASAIFDADDARMLAAMKRIDKQLMEVQGKFAKFFNVLPDGRDRDFDWARIRAILEKVGFRGFLSVEYEGEEADEVAVMRRLAPFLKTLR